MCRVQRIEGKIENMYKVHIGIYYEQAIKSLHSLS